MSEPKFMAHADEQRRELCEALEALLDDIRFLPLGSRDRPLIEKAYAALAKARGETT